VIPSVSFAEAKWFCLFIGIGGLLFCASLTISTANDLKTGSTRMVPEKNTGGGPVYRDTEPERFKRGIETQITLIGISGLVSFIGFAAFRKMKSL
jgi:hypothetical protein